MKIVIYIIMLLITLSGCATSGFPYDDPKLAGYQTIEECRLGKGIEVGASLPPECLKLPEYGF